VNAFCMVLNARAKQVKELGNLVEEYRKKKE
jgi:hypothetical protein